MKVKFFLIMFLIVIVFSLFLIKTSFLSNQKGYLIKMKNGDTFTAGLNETVVIKNIWKDKTLQNWNIRIKILLIDINKEALKVQINSSTFLGEDFSEIKFIKTGGFVSIIQAEEVTSNIGLNKIVADRAIFSLKVQAASPAPELSDNFDVEIKTEKNSGDHT